MVEDNIYRNTGERFKFQKQSLFFWMNFTIGTSGPFDPVFHPLSLLCDDRTDLSFSYPSLSANRKRKMASFISSAESQRPQIYWI